MTGERPIGGMPVKNDYDRYCAESLWKRPAGGAAVLALAVLIASGISLTGCEPDSGYLVVKEYDNVLTIGPISPASRPSPCRIRWSTSTTRQWIPPI